MFPAGKLDLSKPMCGRHRSSCPHSRTQLILHCRGLVNYSGSLKVSGEAEIEAHLES
jgi:hypothetical protein